ncbi:MAG: nitroreductase family protein [Bacillota bacterium]|nr:nitroreductase family protein [Bacillota bacterium]
MNIYETINKRRTVRDFTEKLIDTEIIHRILDAGLKAPSNDHMRSWEFIIVNDMPTRLKLIDKVNKNFTREQITEILDSWKANDQCQREMYYDGIPKQYNMLLTAGCLIIPCFRQDYPLLSPSSLSSLNGFASIWLCIENILLAAAAEGIFGVTRIPFETEQPHIKAVLNIPSNYEVPCYLALGYPKDEPNKIKQIQINVKDRIHLTWW